MSTMTINKVCFYFAIKRNDLERGYESDVVVVSDVPFKIKIAEHSVGDKAVIVRLISSSPTTDLNWTCEADAIIAIRSDQGVHQKLLNRTEFSGVKFSSDSLEFIDIVDLKNYERNGRLVFEVQIRADPVKYSDVFPANVQQIRSIFRFVIDAVSQLGEQSTVQLVCGTEFKISVRKGLDGLQIFLRNEKNPKNEHWMWNVKCGFKLLSFDEHVRPIEKQFYKKFFYNVCSRGYVKFTSWANFVNPLHKYVQDDKAILEIDLEVDPPKPILSFDQLKSIDSAVECSICLLNLVERAPTTTKCGHLFCGDCIKRSIAQRHACPNCNGAATSEDLRRIYF